MSTGKTQRAEDEQAVLLANARFYRAFAQADYATMSGVWAARLPVACLHPGTPLLLGREAVLGSFRQLLSGPKLPLRCDTPIIQLFGDTALVYCYEGNEAQPAHLAATNVFVREDGSWRMVHHQAGPLSQPATPVRNPSWLN